MRTILLALLLTFTTTACGDDLDAATCSDDPEEILKHGAMPCTDAGPPVLSTECEQKLANRPQNVLDLCAAAIDQHGVLDYAIYTQWIEANVPDGTCTPVACKLPDERCFFEDACNPL